MYCSEDKKSIGVSVHDLMAELMYVCTNT